MSLTPRPKPKRSSATPIRNSLRSESPLHEQVKDGLGALSASHRRDHFDKATLSVFADSLDIDEGLKKGRESENRWDYLLGHRPNGELIAVEPHAARSDQIDKVIKKREAALVQLRNHLKDGRRVAKWLWVASRNVQFLPFERATLKLSSNGIEFVGTRIRLKHLP